MSSSFPLSQIAAHGVASSLTFMGQQPAAQTTFDPETREATTTALPVAENLQASSSGDVQPAVHIGAEDAAHENRLIQGKLDSVQKQLAETTYDRETGKPLPKVTGRAREVLAQQERQFKDELQYLGHLIAHSMPNAGKRTSLADAEIIAGVERAQRINRLADSVDASGKPIGRIEATKLIDEASKRALADKLVRS